LICIICRKDKEEQLFNDEHVIPDSLGGKLIIKNVCKDCNSRLGTKIDAKLINNLLVDLVRYVHQIKGKSGKIPFPFKNGVLINDMAQKIQFNGMKPQLSPRVNIDTSNKIANIRVSNQNEANKIIKKILKRQGVVNLSEKELRSNIISKRSTKFQPEIRINDQINIEGIEIALVKIAYEIAYYWLGEIYLNDSLGERISNMIFQYSMNGEYKLEYELIIGKTLKDKLMDAFINKYSPLFKFDNIDIVHIIVLFEYEGQVKCWIRIFDVFERMISVSNDSKQYRNIQYPYLLFCDPISGKHIEGNLVELLSNI
jgi:uncharacterized protein YlaI